MRRSQAPSVLKTIKQPPLKDNSSLKQSKDYKWSCEKWTNSGSSSGSKRRRYFSVLWREASSRKHKIWKGDGVLEVQQATGEAVLRNDSGEYMGSINVLNIMDELQADYQMLVQNKEIEIQEEVRADSEEEIRQRLTANRHLDDKDKQLTAMELEEEKKKRKGRFLMPTYLNLKSPKLPKSFQNPNQCTFEIIQKNMENKTLSETHLPFKYTLQEYICMVKSSELQQYLFGKILEFYLKQHSLKVEENSFEKFNIPDILQMICNHPALINHKTIDNTLMDLLSTSLPDWSEMGPFDSGKLEFLQYFLQNSKTSNTLIITNCMNTLNMLQGLCDFMDIKYCKFDSIAIKAKENENQQVILMQATKPLNQLDKFLFRMRNIIIFENINEMIETTFSREYLEQCRRHLHQQQIQIYYLVTAFSIEDYLLFVHLQNNDNNNELLDIKMVELLDLWRNSNQGAFSLLQSKTEQPLISSATKWLVYESPFAKEFIENSDLKNCEGTIDTILFRELS